MSTSDVTDRSSVPDEPRVHRNLRLLSLILGIEAIAMVIVTGVLVVDLFTQRATSMATAVALTALVALGAVWVIALFIGSLRVAQWVRGGALIWQVIQLAIAVGAFQGETAQPLMGLAILIPTAAAIALLLSKPVTEALRRRELDQYRDEVDPRG
ncbi:hypothetical protein D9V32_07825 [Mycetocola tolaasinivorans]|uniref:Uncharacterized protein n=1 Tax=Mycetocola tolaasinivorans TaxID=76635 RepID=A0A3L7A6U5_9MICO|nr:hypothetical protein [Mycetocola tolaasinivorans]RLP76056.1 hypothetical protein D9V32_07825 [Mycetocola tolaasinivorans]